MAIRNRKALDEVATLQPYTGMMKTMPYVTLVIGDRKATDLDEYLYYDCSAAIQSILMGARRQGLSTCWCAVGPRKEYMNSFRNCCKLKKDLLPVVIVTVGYGCEDKEIMDRFDPDKISYFN